MNDYLIECVPNISEGRDLKKVDQIVKNLSEHDVKVLHIDSGYDANRTVLTLVGRVSEMLKAIKTLYHSAADLIDMTAQKGQHPRLGAVDICPFISFEIKNRSDLKVKVQQLSKHLSQQLSIPIFLYAESSVGSKKKTLPFIRKGEYEMLINAPHEMNCTPDIGREYHNPPFGGSVMGVRDFMVAYNINISTADLTLAKKIAAEMRMVRKEAGHFKGKNIKPLQILGWYIAEYECCQISTNIHNPRELSMLEVYRFTQAISEKHGVKCKSAELIGMVPEFALESCLVSGISENEFIDQLGFDFKGEFSWDEKVLERRVRDMM